MVLTARLREGALERAHELARALPASANPKSFERFGVFLSEFEVIFVMEGPDAKELVREIFDDPVRSTEIAPWLPLFDGPLHRADEVYDWSSSR
jgi:hypothetical protein